MLPWLQARTRHTILGGANSLANSGGAPRRSAVLVERELSLRSRMSCKSGPSFLRMRGEAVVKSLFSVPEFYTSQSVRA